nr:MAG TPA: distal tail protein [Caudoviricetes sp.]
MIDKDLVLYLPFDDPDGSKAYDFSQSRADATLSDGANFTKEAYQGKALAFNGIGEAITSKAIALGSDFTLTLYVKPSGNKIGWLLNLPGVDKFLEQWLSATPNEWSFLAFVKNGNNFTVYHGMSVAFASSLSGTPTGFSLNDQNIAGTYSAVDELRLYSKALTEKEIVQLQKDNDVEYFIDGRNFKEFGVFVSKSSGLTGRLVRKEPLNVDWDDYHGVVRAKKRPRYKEREIELECFIEASSRSAFVEWMDLFFSQFDGEGNHRFKIAYDGNAKPLVYEVELLNGADPEKTWGSKPNEVMVGTFKLKLTEDEPVKRVLRHIGTTANTVASITVTSSKLLNIYWGDGTHTFNVRGNEKTVEHTYTEPGEYDVIVAGVIEDIEKFSTNMIVIWDLLK